MHARISVYVCVGGEGIVGLNNLATSEIWSHVESHTLNILWTVIVLIVLFTKTLKITDITLPFKKIKTNITLIQKYLKK